MSEVTRSAFGAEEGSVYIFLYASMSARFFLPLDLCSECLLQQPVPRNMKAGRLLECDCVRSESLRVEGLVNLFVANLISI